MGRLNSDDTTSPKKTGRRDSWFKRVFTSPSPSKDPVMHDREPTRRVYSKGAENRVAKRRSERSRKRHNMRGEGDNSDAEPATPLGAPAAPVKVPQSALTSIGGFLSWVEAHPHLPSVLSFYMQLAVNTFLGCLFMYIIYSAWSGVMNDVDVESSKHASEIWVEIAFCAKQYRENRCDDRVPISEAMCGNWETCMNRDPKKLARASVTAKTFAMIFNSFVEEFSYKSMVRLCTPSQSSHVANRSRSSLQSSSSAASTSPTGPLACSAPSNNNSNTNPSPNTRPNTTPHRRPTAPPRAPTSKTPSSSSTGRRPTRRPTSPAASRSSSSSSSRLRHRRSSTRTVYLHLHCQARRRRVWGRAPARKSRRRGGEGCFVESSGVVSCCVVCSRAIISSTICILRLFCVRLVSSCLFLLSHS
jgi:hypothetical protein